MTAPPPPEPPLAEVVVTARLPPAAGAQAFSTVSLDSAALAGRPRLDEALSEAPGVSLFRRVSSRGANPTTQGLSLRSIAPSGAGRALVTLDGVPINDPFGGWVIWTAVPPESLDRIDLTRGAGAGPYGAGALTGVVELQSIERAAPFGVLGWETVSSGGGRAVGVGAAPLGRGELLLTASGQHDNGWVPVRLGRGAADDRLTLGAENASARYKLAVGPAVVEARLSGYREDRDAGLVGAGSRAEGAQASLTAAVQPSRDRFGWRAQVWAITSDLANTSVSTSVGRAATTPANDQYSTPALGAGMSLALRRAGPGLEWEVGGDVRYADGTEHELFRYQGGAYTRNRDAGGATVVTGLYAEASRRSGPWLLTGDMRDDLWSSFGGTRLETDRASGAATLTESFPSAQELVPSGRLGLKRDLDNGGYVRAAGYATFRPPTLNELYRPFRVGADVTEANAALVPERLYGIEAGVGQTRPRYAWTLTGFLNRLDDPVTNVTVGVGPGTFGAAGFIAAGGTLRMRENAGRIDAAGLEAEASRKIGERLQLRAALDYTLARVDGESAAPQLTSKRPAEAPRLTVTAGADWTATSRLRLSADLRGESLRYEDDLNTRRLAPSLTVDLRGRFRLNSFAELTAAIDNLADAPVQTGRTADNVASYDAPRTVRVGVALTR